MAVMRDRAQNIDPIDALMFVLDQERMSESKCDQFGCLGKTCPQRSEISISFATSVELYQTYQRRSCSVLIFDAWY